MQPTSLTIVLMILSSLLTGGAIGFGFGADWKNWRPVAPGRTVAAGGDFGSMGKGIALLAVLVLVQILCPLLFTTTATKWWVIAGVAAGYGWQRFRRLRSIRASVRH